MYILDFLSAMFDEGHVMLTVKLTVQYVLATIAHIPPQQFIPSIDLKKNSFLT